MDGEVPEGWRAPRLRELCRLRRDSIDPGESPSEMFRHYSIPAFDEGRGPKLERGRTILSGKFAVPAGSVLFSKLNLRIPRIWLPDVAPEDSRSVCSTEFLVLEPNPDQLSRRFLFHLLKSERLLNRLASGAAATTNSHQRIRPEDLLNHTVNLPPKSQQDSIVEVLDAIDEAIEKTEAVIAATEDVRKALLQELLTRGVPGWHTEWKTVPGIGTIPACWEVVRLGEVVTIKSGQEDPRDAALGDRLFVAPDDVEGETRVLIRRRTVADARAISGKYAFDQHDVIYSKIRPYLKKVYLPDEPGLCSADMYPVRPHDSIDRVFLSWLLLSDALTNYVATCSDRTGIPKVNREGLLAYRFGLPPAAEQSVIAKAIEAAMVAKDRQQHHVDALRNLKTHAADALLSGRLRVTVSEEVMP